MSYCYTCDNQGCERCKGGPGEQGFTLDEKELMTARARVTSLEADSRSTWNTAIEAAAKVVDAAQILPGLAAAVRALRRSP